MRDVLSALGKFFICQGKLRDFQNPPAVATMTALRVLSFFINSEFTQQDGRKKRTAKRLCVTNVTGLLLAVYVVILT